MMECRFKRFANVLFMKQSKIKNKMEQQNKRLQAKLKLFFDVESPYTKEHSLYLTNEIITIISDIGCKVVKK
jgi:hypothetical protein